MNEPSSSKAIVMMQTEGQSGAPVRHSVVLAARDAARFLPATLRSLAAQTRSDFELIAVDDGSTDETPEILRRYAEARTAARPVSLLRTGGAGLAAARNAGLARAQGSLVTFLDGDDTIAPTLLQLASERLESDGTLDVAFPLFEHVDEADRPIGVRTAAPRRPLTPHGILMNNPIHSDSGVTVRRSSAERVGQFDEALTGYVGLDFWHRTCVLRSAGMSCIEAPLVRYRRHGRQITSSAKRMEANFARVVDKAVNAGTITERERRQVLAAHQLYWASIAYGRRRYPLARHYTRAAWQADTVGMAGTPYAYFRGAVALASLLPSRVHEPLRRAGFEALPALRRSRPGRPDDLQSIDNAVLRSRPL